MSPHSLPGGDDLHVELDAKDAEILVLRARLAEREEQLVRAEAHVQLARVEGYRLGAQAHQTGVHLAWMLATTREGLRHNQVEGLFERVRGILADTQRDLGISGREER